MAGLSALTLALLLTIAIVSSVLSFRRSEALAMSKGSQENLLAEFRRGGLDPTFQRDLARARASRHSQRMGQRFRSLKILIDATAYARKWHLSSRSFDTLRSEIIATLVLVDLRPLFSAPPPPRVDSDRRFIIRSPDLQLYASHADREGTIQVRNTRDHQVIARLQGFHDRESDELLKFSPDGRYLAAWTKSRLRVWPLSDPAPPPLIDQAAELSFAGVGAHQFDLFSPDSRRLVVSHRVGRLTLHDLPSGKVVREAAHRKLLPLFGIPSPGAAAGGGQREPGPDLESGIRQDGQLV